LLVMLLFIAAFLAWNPLKDLENKAYDMGVSMAAQPAGNNVVIVAIDDDSIDRMGRWPWPRVIMAKMIERLSSAGARLIGVDVFFSEVQTDQNLQSFKQLTRALARRGDPETKKLLQAAEKSLDMDRMLVNAVKQAGNVVMPISFELGVPHGRMETSPPDYIKRMEIKNINYSRENASFQDEISLSGSGTGRCRYGASECAQRGRRSAFGAIVNRLLWAGISIHVTGAGRKVSKFGHERYYGQWRHEYRTWSYGHSN